MTVPERNNFSFFGMFSGFWSVAAGDVLVQTYHERSLVWQKEKSHLFTANTRKVKGTYSL